MASLSNIMSLEPDLGTTPAKVDQVMGHLFQVFRLRFGHPKGRQSMNEEEAGDFCMALQLVIPAKKLIAMYEKHENHAFKQFVMTRLNNGPDSGGYIIQALREAWATDSYHAALAALRMAYQFLNAVEPDFNTAGPDGYHSPEGQRFAHLYTYEDDAEQPRHQYLDGEIAPGLLNRAYEEPDAELKATTTTFDEMFLLTEEDMCDDGGSTERGSDDGGTEKGFDTEEEDELDSIFVAVEAEEVGNHAGTDISSAAFVTGSSYRSGDETDLESVVIIGAESDLGDISDFESGFDTDAASDCESCRPLLVPTASTPDLAGVREGPPEVGAIPESTPRELGVGDSDSDDIDTGWARESLVDLSSEDEYDKVVPENWEVESGELGSELSLISLTRPH